MNNIQDRMLSIMASNIKVKKYGASCQPFTVLIEGNIGSGKTTFLNHFKQFEDQVCLITEPVDKWRNLHEFNLLSLMYSQPEKWAMPFQSYVNLTMLQSHTMKTDKPVKLMERSLYSSKYCFVENLYKSKLMEPAMYHILQEWYKFIEESIHIRADLIDSVELEAIFPHTQGASFLFINGNVLNFDVFTFSGFVRSSYDSEYRLVYLRTSPDIVYKRIQKRARSEECNISLKYLQELHDLHEIWLMANQGYNSKVIVLNADLDLEQIGTEYRRSENHIINAAFAQQQAQAVLVSPSKSHSLDD